MRSTSCWAMSRTRWRTWSTPSAMPKRRSQGSATSGAKPVIAPPPPEIVRYAPATNMRGPGKSPRAIALRRATSTKAR